MKYTKHIVVILLLIIPAIVYVFGKPLKIIYPELSGVSCVEDWLCIEDSSKEQEARMLYQKGLDRIRASLSPMSKKPRVVFCSTMECFSSFGFSKQAGQSIGSLGVVIAPRGWKQYYVNHELIHQWQSDKYGALNVWLAPDWVTEGMAYTISEDPREILSEPFNSYRKRYIERFGELTSKALIEALRSEI